MRIAKPILSGLMCFASFSPVKAQKALQISVEAGVNGGINKEFSYFQGLHGVLNKEKNVTDMYCGFVLDSDKNCTFEGQLENEYSWSKNIGSWVRETFHLSKSETSLSSEIAPAKINKSFGKFDTFVAPVYKLDNDFRQKEAEQSLGVVLNATYNADSKNSVKFEAEYTSVPNKNLFKTKFENFKDNLSLVVSYIRNF